MPELPELEVVRQVLMQTVAGSTICQVDVAPKGGAIVVRDLTHRGFATVLEGSKISTIHRRGKFLRFEIESTERFDLVINPKLSGRLQLARAGDKALPKTHIVFGLSSGRELRYVDAKTMGQVYLTKELQGIPDWTSMGPEPFGISLPEFKERLRHFQGEIKGILTRGEFVAGIGNAYADEILWAAGIHPFRRRSTLTVSEIDRLFSEMRKTLNDAIKQVEKEMGDSIHLKPREFLKVHMKTGETCPRCGSTISLVGANQRITNFCRKCQPGGLIKGM